MADSGTHLSPGNALLSVERERRGVAVVVRFTGEIDLSCAAVMREALAAALAEVRAPHPVVVDLTGVAFFSSAGIAELAKAHQQASKYHTPLRIVATGRTVLRPLEATGMAAILDIHPTSTAALAPPLRPAESMER